MAFAPDYATTRKFYVYYTDTDGAMTVAEYLRDPVNPDIADPNSRREVLSIPHPRGNHNGGQLQFGPDGYLYLATGDGGGGGDPDRAGQNLGVLPGQALADQPELGPAGEPYTDSRRQSVCRPARSRRDLGLRAPEPVALLVRPGNGQPDDRRRRSGRLGGDRLRPGAERWTWHELRLELHGGSPPLWQLSGAAEPRPPVWEYSHGSGCSITGGYVVRDPALPSLFGRYVYTDFCSRARASGSGRSCCSCPMESVTPRQA